MHRDRLPARITFALAVVALGAAGAWRHAGPGTTGSRGALAEGQPEVRGVLPGKWINGADCETEPDYQVHAYSDDFFIIRQSKCLHFEAPFLYLIFGDDRALLLDTGSISTAPLATTIRSVIDGWLQREGRASIPLIVAHTHSHFDHVQGDAQFVNFPDLEQIVGLSQGQVEAFWGFADYPNDTPTIDLGGRVLDVIGTPGHHPASVTLYDRRTHLLLTGDTVYPGHLFTFAPGDVAVLKESTQRLIRFASRNHVQWILGCHIEYSNVPGEPFPYGETVHVNEHPLQLEPSILFEIEAALSQTGTTGGCRIFDEFVIHPVDQCGIFWNG